MKRLVFTLHFWLKRLCGIKMIINAITQIQEKTTNTTQDQTEFES